MMKPLVVAIAIGLGTLAAPAFAVQYKATDLGVDTTWNNGYTARSLNNSGEVLAYYRQPYGGGKDWLVERPAVWNGSTWQVMPDMFLLAPVPEPETYALMLAGLGLVGFAARRRRSA